MLQKKLAGADFMAGSGAASPASPSWTSRPQPPAPHERRPYFDFLIGDEAHVTALPEGWWARMCVWNPMASRATRSCSQSNANLN